MNELLKLIFIGILICCVACTPTVRFTSYKNVPASTVSKSSSDKPESKKAISAISVVPAPINKDKQRGNASYYHDKFEGNLTASGEKFSQSGFTAAHRDLPFGTVVRVRRLSNDKSVIVKINDRGPFAPARIIDLSYAAASEIDLINDGVAEVEIEIIK